VSAMLAALDANMSAGQHIDTSWEAQGTCCASPAQSRCQARC
jgi:hypothetical protein